MKKSVLIGALIVGACGVDFTSPSAPGVDETAVLVGSGDIGQCGSAGAVATGRLLDHETGTVFAAGDIAYPDGSAEQFRDCYDPVWGRHKERTRPSPGNHEYGSSGAAPYFAYFGPNAGPPGRGFYRYRKGAWQVLSLNSNLDGSERGTQLEWLRAELADESSECSVAYFHHPRFSSGPHGVLPPPGVVSEIWRLLHTAGADVVISAHEHFYERFAPQTPDGESDPAFGLRQFVVGTGGAQLTQPVRRVPNSEVSLSAFGLLRLTLDPGMYRWEFVAAEGGAVLDSGSGNCHGKPRR
jgi:hypothetical protein